MAGALHPDEFGNVVQILAEDVLSASLEHRHRTRAECEQAGFSGRIIRDVDSNEGNVFFRKKLFRSEATASAGLGVQDKIAGGIFHIALDGTKCCC
jgi:hypothetical protein